ncbi:MAG: DUF5372 family protein, partial [Candidatus Hydrogenedentes bacterium]|nr:DUF5372 family protein [Candidatus Hydrogenedentota bacterium]
GKPSLFLMTRKTIRSVHCQSPSIAPNSNAPQQCFRVTHPFHPLRGEQFEVLKYRQPWGEDRVYFYNREGRSMSLPASWTDLSAPDPFVVISSGRSCFRLIDLIELRRLLTWLDDPDCKDNSVIL